MEATSIVRIILIIISSLSMVLQIIGLTGPAWFGYSVSMNIKGVKIHQHIEGGLFHIPPLEICYNPGYGTVCKTPEEFPPEYRKILDGLFELVATGIQLSQNNNTKHGLRLLGMVLEKQGIQMQEHVITAWAAIITGIGAATAIIVGIIVAILACGKKYNKTVILYSELQGKDKIKLMFDQDDYDD